MGLASPCSSQGRIQAEGKRKLTGTRPWLAKAEYVDYDPKIIAPGVKAVKCRNKKVRIVRNVGEKIAGFEDNG